MKALKRIFPVAALSLFSSVFAAQSGGVTIAHYEPLQRLSIQSAGGTLSQKFQRTTPVTLTFDALGQSFDFELEPNNGFLSAASRDALPDGVGIYRGRLAGNAESWARIVVYEGIPRGLFWDGNEMYAIEAPGDSIVQSNSPVIYRLADTFIEPGTMSCGTSSMSGSGATMYSKLVGELGAIVAQGPGAISEITMGAVGDFEFTDAKGGDAAAAAAIATRLNLVDGIYSQEIGVQINIPLIETYSDPADPFTGETNSGLLLRELRTYRQSTPAQNSLGLTHLFTGRNLDGSTVGIGFSDVLCRTNDGAALSEGNASATFDSLVAAHEIGHNFGAPHDGEPGACESEPTTFIMAPMINTSDQFSPCSIAIMQANAAQASCITPLLAVDMAVALSGMAATVLLGSTADLTVSLSNNGGSQATNVAADITVPGNVSLVSVTASSGSCSSGAGTVNCLLGVVPGQSARTVTLTTTASSVGIGSFDATVTSDVDERPGNNQASRQLTVDPAVDLVLQIPTITTIDLDQSKTINAILENVSTMNATGVSLSISIANGVRADSATWSIGTCTVAAQQIDCQAANFANLSGSTLSVGVTGVTVGNRNVTLTLTSNEADADPSNNTVNVSVRVNDPDDEGGAGATSLPFLWLLASVVFMIRRRYRAPGVRRTSG